MKQFIRPWLALLLVWACASPKQKEEILVKDPIDKKGVEHQLEEYATKYHMLNDEQKPFCSIYFSIPIIKSGLSNDVLPYVEEQMENLFFKPNNGGTNLQDKFKVKADRILADYRDLEQDLADTPGDLSSSFNWTFEYALEIFSYSPRFLTFRLNHFENTGSSQPVMNTYYYQFDVKRKKQLDLVSVFGEHSEKKLKEKILKSLREHFRSDDEFEMNIWKENLKPTTNFYVEDSSFVFYYNPNEIGPPSQGPIELYFHYNDLKPLLNKDFKLL